MVHFSNQWWQLIGRCRWFNWWCRWSDNGHPFSGNGLIFQKNDDNSLENIFLSPFFFCFSSFFQKMLQPPMMCHLFLENATIFLKITVHFGKSDCDCHGYRPATFISTPIHWLRLFSFLFFYCLHIANNLLLFNAVKLSLPFRRQFFRLPS